MSVVPPTAPPRPRPKKARSLWLYPALLLAASCALGATQRDPQHDLDELVAAMSVNAGNHHRAGAANVNVFPGRGWVYTAYVGDTRRYGPGSFLVLTKVDGRLTGELLGEPDAESGSLTQVALIGPALDVYLRRAGLDLRGLDAVFAARFTTRPQAPGPPAPPTPSPR